jgi:acyl-CoA synthetase (AMP-forming)/AMP-acid ligase II
MPDLTIVDIFDAVAAHVPARAAIIEHSRTTTYGGLADDSRRLAGFLSANGIGLRRERAALSPWESGHDHIGLFMLNCAEYMGAELGLSRARAAGININHRYVGEELAYLAADASLKGLIFHSRFAAQVAELQARHSKLELLIQVPDESGAALLPGAIFLADALAEGAAAATAQAPHPDDLHILYTGGTTGLPKGVLWRQADLIMVALGGRRAGGKENDVAAFVHAAGRGSSRTLTTGPFMHASGRWTALGQLLLGNAIVLPRDVAHFDADDVLSTLADRQVNGLNITGDAVARPLIAQLEKADYDLSALRSITSGAAILSAASKRDLMRLLPGVTIVDTMGSSETGPQASAVSGRDGADMQSNFGLQTGTTILADDLSGLLPKSSAPKSNTEVGWVARTGRVPLGYLGDAAKTLRAFPTIDGIRYAVPGDRARWAGDGSIELLGRDAATINTGGEKVFAEEVEMALKRHGAIEDVVVCGRPSDRWGQEVVAVVALRPGERPCDAALLAEAGKTLARYKLPKAFIYRDAIARSISGKPDYAWARAQAIEEAQGTSHAVA